MGLKEKVALGLILLTAAGGVAETADASKRAHPNKQQKAKVVKQKQPKVKVRNFPDGSSIKVVKIKAKSVGYSNKFKHCLAKAEKREQPAPPVDPYANCRGDVSVKVVARAVAKCRKGWMGGRAAARASVRQRIHVRAWSRSIASGRAEAKAETRIRDRVTTRARVSVDCVKLTPGQKIPGTTPGTTPEIPPESQIPPKDGTPGAGEGTPGQPGGGGSGGDGNTSPNSVACYDPYTQGDGDQNPNTGGAPMWGTGKDQYDGCIGPAEPAVN
jgi:hypothetical protein